MAYSNSWSNIIPVSSDPLNTTDDQLRRLRLDVQERMDDLVDDWTTDPVVPQKLDVSRIDGTPDLAVVYTNAAFSLPSSPSRTIIDFVAETLDTGSFHDNSSNPSRLTITTAAYYRITANITVAVSTNAITANLAILKNGSLIGSHLNLVGISASQTLQLSVIDLAAATDYYEVGLIQQSTDTWTTASAAHQAFFMIERLVGTT